MAKGINTKKKCKEGTRQNTKRKERQKRNLKRVSSSFYVRQRGCQRVIFLFERCDDL